MRPSQPPPSPRRPERAAAQRQQPPGRPQPAPKATGRAAPVVRKQQEPRTTAILSSKVVPTERVKERQKEKSRARRRNLLVKAALVVLAALIAGLGVWAVFFSSLFQVAQDDLVVVPAEGVDMAAVEARMRAEVGVSLALVSTSGLERDLEENPEISSATVERSWPRGLRVAVEPRVPLFAVASAGAYHELAADGVIVRKSEEISPGLIPVTLSSGTVPTATQTKSMTEVWFSLPPEISEHVAGLEMLGSNFTLRLNDGREILWGDDQDLELKAEVLTLLLAQRPATLYDVSTPTRPAVR